MYYNSKSTQIPYAVILSADLILTLFHHQFIWLGPFDKVIKTFFIRH
jgi:hypothetical protein